MEPSSRFDRAQAAAYLAGLARQRVFLGTSSWKYPGWCGQLYTEDRYTFRGAFAEKRFQHACLAEYAEVFHTVGVDATYYRFPDERLLAGLAAQVPRDFRFSLKVTDEITLKRFTRLPRFGARAGQPNDGFLDAGRFAERFLTPCDRFRDQIGVLMFEFSRFYPSDFARGREFVTALEGFLGRLPKGWRYAVEIRNPAFLQPAYFETLASQGVAHIFNSWQAMPDLAAQLELAAGQPHADFTVARLLLRPGRDYEEAVRRFAPYQEVGDPYPEGRDAALRLIQNVLGRRGPGQAFVYVNNRFEGNALQTIAALLAELPTSAPSHTTTLPGPHAPAPDAAEGTRA